MMKKGIWALLFFSAVVLFMGCTSKRGIIALRTRPAGADVYLNQLKVGVTGNLPLEFEYDFRQPATLNIEKEGYYPESEMLGETWIVREYQKGTYMEGKFIIQGKNRKAWKANILRRLQKKEEE